MINIVHLLIYLSLSNALLTPDSPHVRTVKRLSPSSEMGDVLRNLDLPSHITPQLHKKLFAFKKRIRRAASLARREMRNERQSIDQLYTDSHDL